MNRNKTNLIIALILIIVVGVIYSATRPKMIPLTVVPDTTTPDTAQPHEEAEKKFCYLQTTTGENNLSDYQFVSINYGDQGQVTGIINWLPAEKDSMVGTYTGTISSHNDISYPSKITAIYTSQGEGIVSKQQEMFIVGKDSIKQAIGEKIEGADGVWKFKDMAKVTYPNKALPIADCGTIPERITKNYMPQ